MTQNLASMQITQEIENQVMALLDQIESLLTGLITLPDRTGLLMMGPKSERYVRGSVELGQQNAGLIPPDVDLAGAVADLEARDRMMRITNRLKLLTTKCEDTTDALGSDLMVVSNIIYAILKVLGKASGLDEAFKELGYRWARGKKKPKSSEETPAGPDDASTD